MSPVLQASILTPDQLPFLHFPGGQAIVAWPFNDGGSKVQVLPFRGLSPSSLVTHAAILRVQHQNDQGVCKKKICILITLPIPQVILKHTIILSRRFLKYSLSLLPDCKLLER